jgi:hypothetical protein
MDTPYMFLFALTWLLSKIHTQIATNFKEVQNCALPGTCKDKEAAD